MKLNKKTQKAQTLLANYERAKYSELWEVYGSYSAQKARSFETIKREMAEFGGYGLRITGHNTCTYSCGYLMTDDDGVVHLVYHTPSYRYMVEY